MFNQNQWKSIKMDYLLGFQNTSKWQKVKCRTGTVLLKGQYHAIFSNTSKIEKTLFGW